MMKRNDFTGKQRHRKEAAALSALRGMEYVLYVVGFSLLFYTPVHAYIDPSVMTYAIQAVAGLVIASGTFLGIFWRKMRRRLMGGKTVRESKYHQFESDALEFLDPENPGISMTPEDIPYHGPIRFNNGEKADVEIRLKDSRPPHKLTWAERIGDIVPIVLMLAVTFGVFMPSSLYLGNVNEFIFDYAKDVLPIILSVSCIGFVALELLLSIFPGRLYLILSSLVFSIGLGFYIQGNFLNPKFTYLNGTAIDWTKYASYQTTGTIVWSLLFIIPLILVLWKTKAGRVARTGISLFLAAVQITSLFYMDMSTKKTLSSDVYVTKVGEWDLSKHNNTVVFLVDTLDAAWFESYVMSDPEYIEYFKDFTYYSDCVGGGAPTLLGVPLLFTGRNYMSDKPRTDYYQEAYQESHLFRDLVASGDKVKLFVPYEYIGFADLENIENVESQTNFVIGDDLKFAEQLYQLTAFFAMPMQLKKNFWMDSSGFNKLAAAVNNDNPMFTEDDPQMRIDLNNSGVTANMNEDLFVYYHMFGAHGPYRMNAEGERVPDSLETSAHREQIRGCLNIIHDVMTQMKELGVYDNSTFIVMADHGGIQLYQNPTVLIKKPGETHDSIVTNDAPIIFQNVRATIAKSLLSAEEMTEDYGKAADEVTMEDNPERFHTATRVLGSKMYGDNPWVMAKDYALYKFYGTARDLDRVEVVEVDEYEGEND